MNTESNHDKGFAAELDSKITGELVGLGAVEIFGALTASIPGLGGIGATALAAWQMDQQRKFAAVVKQLLKTLDEEKLDRDYLKSDEFKELWIKIRDEASKTGSERKQLALAGALVNSCTPLGSKVSGKFFLLSTLLSMSEDELAMLEAIQDRQSSYGVYKQPLAHKLQWDEGKVQAVCDELEHQGILSATKFGDWIITSRGKRLIEWCTGIEQIGNLSSLKANLRQEIASDITRDIIDSLGKAAMQARGL